MLLDSKEKDGYVYEYHYMPEGGTECFTPDFAYKGYSFANIYHGRQFVEWYVSVYNRLNHEPHWEYVVKKDGNLVAGHIFSELNDFEVGRMLGLLVAYNSEPSIPHSFGCWRWMIKLGKERSHHTVMYSRLLEQDNKTIRYEYVYKRLEGS